MPSKPTLTILTLLALIFPSGEKAAVGDTDITKWMDGKKAAVSLTFDDSTINQFRVAMPIMNRLGLPGTFYIITGAIPGSRYKPEFVGRPVEEIIAETAETSTDEENFFERASAIRFLGYDGTYEYHNRAGRLFESGDIQEAYRIIDEGYRRVREGAFGPDDGYSDELYNVLAIDDPSVDLITWEELRKFEKQGHEFGSHTILHPYLAILDSANIHHELVNSREDIRNQLGAEHIFSAECPFGTEDPRVMEYAYDLYPALRNRMPHPWLEELNRSSDDDPAASGKEYVQWQRGALSDTPMRRMKSWVDTSLANENIWLVLVFHGVEGIGWEPLTEAELREYYRYIAARQDDLWVATFKDVTRYIRERMNATIENSYNGETISISLTHSLGTEWYHHPLTLKTYVPGHWNSATATQGDKTHRLDVAEDENGRYVLYSAQPNADTIVLTAD